MRASGCRATLATVVATSGEAGIEALQRSVSRSASSGLPATAQILEGRGVRIADGEDFTDLAWTGIREERARAVRTIAQSWERCADRDMHMHCLNPDRLVDPRRAFPRPAPARLADIYAMLGGRVTWYGKPYPAIYRHALRLAGDPPKDEVLAVGDGLQTDILGAARMGFDTVFVTAGSTPASRFRRILRSKTASASWQPVAVVDGLA